MPRTGRPKTGETPRKSLRVTEQTWKALERIAAREGLLWGGHAAPGLAVTWLAERDQERFR